MQCLRPMGTVEHAPLRRASAGLFFLACTDGGGEFVRAGRYLDRTHPFSTVCFAIAQSDTRSQTIRVPPVRDADGDATGLQVDV